MLDPRQLLMPTLLVDPSLATALLRPPAQSEAGGKLSSSSSFRISELLHSPEQQNSSIGSEMSIESHSPLRGSSPDGDRQSPDGHGNKKTRKARTIFTDKQLQELESTFEKQKYLSVQDRMDLAQRMGLSDTQVKTWYQNRRTKWKRQASVGMDLLADANNLAAVQHLLRTNPYWSTYFATHQLAPRPFLPVGMPLVPAVPAQIPPSFPLLSLLKPDLKPTDIKD